MRVCIFRVERASKPGYSIGYIVQYDLLFTFSPALEANPPVSQHLCDVMISASTLQERE